MGPSTLRRRLSRSRLAAVALLPKRTLRVLRHDVGVVRVSARWLIRSREHHNYTYHLTAINSDHLAWFVAAICKAPVTEIRGYLAELAADTALSEHIAATTAASARRWLADREIRYGRRAGWYAIVRALKPRHVVETGVDKGLGTAVLAAALLRNGADGYPGRVTAIDINPEAGYLVRSGPLATVVDLVFADSARSLAALDRPVDLFLHDSDHSAQYETSELAAVQPHLAPAAMLLTDNVTVTSVLSRYAERTGRQFLAFTERPANHWYAGDGIGAAWGAADGPT